MIGIGCLVYVMVGQPIIGAFLFSLGLLTVIEKQYNLYTGKAGYANNLNDYKNLGLIWMGNFIGIFLVVCMAYIMGISTITIATAKLSLSIPSIFVRAIGCGALMYTAVSCKKTPITILCVMTFILCGFEHSIADMFYLGLSNIKIHQFFGYIGIISIGNWLGSQIIHRLNS